MTSPRRPSAARPRSPGSGRLPAAVYWRRRAFVLVLAFALVFVIARWLGGGSDAKSDEEPTAQQAGAPASATGTVTAGSDQAASTGTAGTPASGTTTALATPEGPCDAADVVVTPSVLSGSVAGRDVTVRLSLQSIESSACTWQVNRNSIALRIAKGDTEIWSSRQCPKAVPTTGVVVRHAVATVVELTWNARESNVGCTNRGRWVFPGKFSIAAAALGGEPTTTDFSLGKPAPATITPTPKVSKTTPTPKTRSTKPVN